MKSHPRVLIDARLLSLLEFAMLHARTLLSAVTYETTSSEDCNMHKSEILRMSIENCY